MTDLCSHCGETLLGDVCPACGASPDRRPVRGGWRVVRDGGSDDDGEGDGPDVDDLIDGMDGE